MREIDPDGATRLLAAVVRQWLRDEPSELPAVAAWLGLPHSEMQRRLHPPTVRVVVGERRCDNCGAPLPAHDGPGRTRRWCSERCRHQYSKRRYQ